MELRYILCFSAVLLFCLLIFLGKCNRSSYIMFVLYFLPIMDLRVTPYNLGGFTVFNCITIIGCFYLYRDIQFMVSRKLFYLVLALMLASVLLIGSLQSEFVIDSILNVIRSLTFLFFVKIVVEECIQDELFVKSIIKSLNFGCLLSIGFLAAQMIIGLNFTFYPKLNPNIFDSNVLRYPSFFDDPQAYAQFLAMNTFLFLIKPKKAVNPSLRNVLLFVLVVCVLFVTGGRSGFLGLCVGMAFIFLFAGNRFRIIALSCCLLAYILIVNFGDSLSLFNRQDGVNDSYLVRAAIWKEAYRIFQANPVVGVGLGNYQSYVSLHTQDGYYLINGEVVYYGTESGYLRVLTETGVMGFVVIFSLVLSPVIAAIRSVIIKVSDMNTVFVVGAVLSWLVAFATLYSIGDERILLMLVSLLSLLIIESKRAKSIHV